MSILVVDMGGGRTTAIIDHLETVASRRSGNKFRHAAAVISHGRIVGIGYNRDTKIFQSGRFITGRHAETDALWNAIRNLKRRGKKLRKHEIIVVRSKMGNSSPCCNCVNSLRSIGTARVHYSADGGHVVCLKVENLEYHVCTSSSRKVETDGDEDGEPLLIRNC